MGSTLKTTALIFGILLVGRLAVAGPTPNSTSKAEARMVSACKIDFPDEVQGKSVAELDTWAEAQESGDNAVGYKASKCFRAHEKWEKLALKNEWSPENQKRLPASHSE